MDTSIILTERLKEVKACCDNVYNLVENGETDLDSALLALRQQIERVGIIRDVILDSNSLEDQRAAEKLQLASASTL